MTEDSGPSGATESCSKAEPSGGDSLSSQRVFKKSSPNNKLTLYLSSRDLVVSTGSIDRLQGVVLVDPEFIEDRKVYGQITLTFRYGREDEEVMGLKFCNEAVMCLAQLYPTHPGTPELVTPLQEALMKRLGPNAYPFNMEITPLAPPSVQLVPAKEYNGAPIGTSYDIRAYIAERSDEKLHRRTTVRMGIRVVQKAFPPPSPYDYNPSVLSGHKDRGKHKITLFGMKSAPLDSTKLFNQQMQQQQQKMARTDRNDVVAISEERLNGAEVENRIEKSHVVDFEEGSKDVEEMEEVRSNGSCGDMESSTGEKEETQNRETGEITETNDDITCDNEKDDEKPQCNDRRVSLAAILADIPAPHAIVEKPFLLSDGRIELEASLDKAVYSHGEEIQVTVHIQNNSNKTIRRIKVFIVQHVDVCMFSNGKFKNVVAIINSKEDCPISSGKKLTKIYSLLPVKSSTKNWIALEDSYTKTGTSLASSVTSYTNNPDERNVFAIYVSYYVKVKLMLSVMGGEVSLKLPFTLMQACSEFDPNGTLTRIMEPPVAKMCAQPEEDVKPEKDGT